MPKAYVINTNRKNSNFTDEMDMIKNQKCSAYYAPWKNKIDRIEANDIVFLYSNERGITARGMATGLVEVADYNGGENEEHYMHLNRFEKIHPKVKSATINEVLDTSLVLNRAVIELPYDQGLKLWQFMTKNQLHLDINEREAMAKS